jgi:hypothetical protein
LSTEDVEPYSLHQRDIFPRLQADVDFFRKCISAAAVDLATEFECAVELSRSRLTEVWDYWRGDMKRTKDNGFSQVERDTLEDHYETSIELDHFKRAAFLCFWLRRLSPIIVVESTGGSSTEVKRIQGRYFAFSNELLSYSVSLQLCAYYEFQKWRSRELAFGDPELLILRRMKDWEKIRDYVMVMRHKNISPHAIYLILKSLYLE